MHYIIDNQNKTLKKKLASPTKVPSALYAGTREPLDRHFASAKINSFISHLFPFHTTSQVTNIRNLSYINKHTHTQPSQIATTTNKNKYLQSSHYHASIINPPPTQISLLQSATLPQKHSSPYHWIPRKRFRIKNLNRPCAFQLHCMKRQICPQLFPKICDFDQKKFRRRERKSPIAAPIKSCGGKLQMIKHRLGSAWSNPPLSHSFRYDLFILLVQRLSHCFSLVATAYYLMPSACQSIMTRLSAIA